MLSPGFYNFEPIREGANLTIFRLDTPSGEFYDVILQSNGAFEVVPLDDTASRMMNNQLFARIEFQLKEMLRGNLGRGDLSFGIH